MLSQCEPALRGFADFESTEWHVAFCRSMPTRGQHIRLAHETRIAQPLNPQCVTVCMYLGAYMSCVYIHIVCSTVKVPEKA